MVSKLKLKNLFTENVKKFKSVEKSNPEMNIFGVLFELSSCHVISIEEIHKILAKIKSFYMDFNEFRVTEIDDICKDFNITDRIDEMLTFIECLDNVFEKNGKVDLFDVSKYDETKLNDLFSRLSGNINGSCYSYYLNRLGKEGPYVFSDNQVRILKRLNIVEETEEFEAIKKKVEKVFPAEKGVSFFLACQVHANEYCREDNPSCTRCPFLNECEFGKNVVKERTEKEKERELVRQKALEEEQRKIENEKKKVKVSSKKKDKNDPKEGADGESDDGLVSDAPPVLTKRELKKILRLKEAEEKAALKLAAKLAKKQMKEDAKKPVVKVMEGEDTAKKKSKKSIALEPTISVEPKKLSVKEKKLLEKNILLEQAIAKQIEDDAKANELLKANKKSKKNAPAEKENKKEVQTSAKTPEKIKGKKSAEVVIEQKTSVADVHKASKESKKDVSSKVASKTVLKPENELKKVSVKSKDKTENNKIPAEIIVKKENKKSKEIVSEIQVKATNQKLSKTINKTNLGKVSKKVEAKESKIAVKKPMPINKAATSKISKDEKPNKKTVEKPVAENKKKIISKQPKNEKAKVTKPVKVVAKKKNEIKKKK